MDDINKKLKEQDVFKPPKEDVLSKTIDYDLTKANNDDIFAYNKEDIFEEPGYQANIFEGDDEEREPVVKFDKFLSSPKYKKSRVKVVERTLKLYMKGDVKSDKESTRKHEQHPVKPKKVTIQEGIDFF